MTQTINMTRIWILVALSLLGCSRTTLSDQLSPSGGGFYGTGGSSQFSTGGTPGVGGSSSVIAGTVGGDLGGNVGGNVGGLIGGTSATGGFIPAGGTFAGSIGAGGLPTAGGLVQTTGGVQMPAGGGLPSGSGGSALDILNPQGCATMYPFVLTIEPSGDRGTVSGWLDSAPSVAFEQGLPRFAVGFSDSGDISTWWSVAYVDSNGSGALYFYGGLDPGSPIRIAVAEGATDFSNIDRNALMFVQGATRSMKAGEIAVVYNPDNGVSFAIRADALYITASSADPSMPQNCTAIDASWTFTF